MPKDKTLKTNSIYYRFLKLLALAFVTAALFFLLLNQGGEKLLDYYFTKTNYMERENARRYNDLRDYVKKTRTGWPNGSAVRKSSGCRCTAITFCFTTRSSPI